MMTTEARSGEVAQMATQILEMVETLRRLGAPEYGQYESIVRARYGGDFDVAVFAAACDIAETSDDAASDEAAALEAARRSR